MSGTSKEPDASGEIRNNSPVLHPESPSNSHSARLQEEYSELLRYAVGMPGPDRRDLESSGRAFQPISRSGSSSARQTPVDQQHEWDLSLKSLGNGGSGNINTNALYSAQPQRFKSQTTTRVMDMNVVKNVDDEETQESTSAGTSTVMTTVHATILEPALTCLSGKLDSWLGKLKNDILAEFRHLTVQALDSQQMFHQVEIKEINSAKQHLEQEINRLNEMVNTCEQSMSRKDTVIENVTQALGKQRDKVTMAQAFYHARAEHAEAKKEKFTEALAMQHNTRRLTQKVLRAWFGLIQKNWKNRFEQLYDKKAQEVCKQLSIDYEDKIRALNEEIENTNRRLKTIHNEREQYALQVKKAFMRGVCALNMETMSAFTQEETQIGPLIGVEENSNACNINNNLESSDFPQKDDILIQRVFEDVVVSGTPDQHLGGGQFSALTVVGTGHPQQSKFKPPKGKSRPSTAPSVSSSHQTKTWGISQSLAPPMASVVVERHDPVTKQTVGKATASRYPKHSTSKSTSNHTKHKHGGHSSVSRSLPVSQVLHTFQPLAGQSTSGTSPGIKVVE